MSVSAAASCLRIANISSCLRMVLAFSTPFSSANETSSAGVLDLRSWSLISRIGGGPVEYLRGGVQAGFRKSGREKRGPQAQSEVSAGRGFKPDAAAGSNRLRNDIRLRGVGCLNIEKRFQLRKQRKSHTRPQVCSSERFDDRQ